MGSFRATLSHPPLRCLLQAQVPADFGDFLDFAAIGALLAYRWQVEPRVYAFLAVAMALPYVVVGPLAGAVVDRASVKLILVASNAGRGLATLALTFAPGWQTLLALILIRSAVDAFFTPARQAALQAFTTPGNRQAANGLSHTINQVSKIIAPAIGGGLLYFLPPQDIFAVNAALSGLAATMLLRLPEVERSTQKRDTAETPRGFGAGLGAVAAEPLLRAALLLMAAGYFAMFFYDTLLAPMTARLGLAEWGFGLALSAVGVGGTVGALVMAARPATTRPFLWIALGNLISALSIAAIGIADLTIGHLPLAAYLLLLAAAGAATSVSLVPFRTLIQDQVEPDRIGRVTALSEAMNTVAITVAPFIGAAIAEATSMGWSFVAGATVMLAVAARAHFLNRHRG